MGIVKERESGISEFIKIGPNWFLMKILRLNKEFLSELRDLATSQVLNDKTGGV